MRHNDSESLSSKERHASRRNHSYMVEKEIVLVPVVEHDNTNKLIDVVARLDILREKVNEGFITIEKREALSRTQVNLPLFISL